MVVISTMVTGECMFLHLPPSINKHALQPKINE